MPCKSGIRQNLERAKQFYEKQKQYDPQRELWKSLVYRVHKTEAGFSGLSPVERTYYSVSILEGEVHNGGFDQFFWNSSGSIFSEACTGLKILGADQSLALLIRAKHVIFGDEEPPTNWDQRREMLQLCEAKRQSPELREIDQAFWKYPDKLSERLMAFATENGLVAPFEKAPSGTDNRPPSS
jgi:hypothetical protein